MKNKKIIKFLLIFASIYFAVVIIGLALSVKDLLSLKNSKIDTEQGSARAFGLLRSIRIESYPARPLLIWTNNSRKKLSLLDQLVMNQNEIVSLLGYSKEANIMMVLQNNAEIRPSGGIWGAYGILKIKNGAVSSFNTYDTYYMDEQNRGKFQPPAEISSIIENEWRFWNANWSPDFRKSVEQGLFFYNQVVPEEPIDAVLGPNLDYIVSLLKLSGPISLANHSFKLTSENFIDKMIYEPSSPAVYESQKNSGTVIDPDEKNVMIAGLGTQLIQQIRQNGKLLDFLDTTFDALEQKDLQLYFKPPRLQQMFENLGWAGRFAGKGNFVMVVDANMGSKLDLFVSKDIRLTPLADRKYKIDISYRNNANLSKVKQQFVVYRDYLRVFLPRGVKLLDQNGGEIAAEVKQDQSTGSDYISTMLIINPGQTKSVSFTWQLPESIHDQRLKVLGQSGQYSLLLKNLHRL